MESRRIDGSRELHRERWALRAGSFLSEPKLRPPEKLRSLSEPSVPAGGMRYLPPAHGGPRCSGRSKQRPYGTLLRQDVWEKKARASSRTPQNCGEASFGVRRLAAAFAGATEATAIRICRGLNRGDARTPTVKGAGGTPALRKPAKLGNFSGRAREYVTRVGAGRQTI